MSVVQWLRNDEEVLAMIPVQGIDSGLSESPAVTAAVLSAGDEEEEANQCLE